jgi:uncharacterized membrane protein YiaA
MGKKTDFSRQRAFQNKVKLVTILLIEIIGLFNFELIESVAIFLHET